MRKIIGNNNADNYIEHLNKYMLDYEINTLPRIQFFIAIACGETGGFHRLDENMNYSSADNIKKVFKNISFQNEDMSQYISNPQNLGNKVYGGKYGNNTINDGWDFRGGGLFQLTFRGNYQAFANSIGGGTQADDLIQPGNEYCVREIKGAVHSACFYVKNRGILPEADKNTTESFITACRKVGACPDGTNYGKKRDYWKRCKAYIGGNGIIDLNNENTSTNTQYSFLIPSGLNVFLEAKKQKKSR